MENLVPSQFSKIELFTMKHCVLCYVKKNLFVLINPFTYAFCTGTKYSTNINLQYSTVQLMYKFHYDIMKPKYGNNVFLLYAGTDSSLYEIKSVNFYSYMCSNELSDYFDTSDSLSTRSSTLFSKK